MNSSLYSATRRPTVVVLTTVAVFACAMMAVQHQRKQTPGPAVASRTRPPQIQSCVDCHDIAKQFDSVPHAQTLRSPGVSVLQKQFSGQSFKAGDRSSTYRFFEEDDGSLWCENDSYPQAVSVDWLLGSGRHAITPVSTWTNSAGQTELLELAVSWYPEQGLGLTLGQSAETLQDAIGIDRLGKRLSHGESLECLGCHSRLMKAAFGFTKSIQESPATAVTQEQLGMSKLKEMLRLQVFHGRNSHPWSR